MSPDLPQRRHPRLHRAAYADPAAVCSVTIAVKARVPLFADAAVAAAVVAMLPGQVTRTGVSVHAFCVMPDHVHLVLSPSLDCDIVRFVGQFKNLAQRAAWRHGVVGAFWQTGFWDHFVRRDEQAANAIRYVLDNPVRAGLVADASEYPFSGCLPGDRS